MNISWEYLLPTDVRSIELHYEAPILAGADYLYYASQSLQTISLHIVNCHTGRGSALEFPKSAYLRVRPREFFGFFHKGLAYYYAADLYVLKDDQLIATVPLSENREFNSWLLRDGRLYLAIGHRPFEKLMCIDLDSLQILWSIDIGSKKNYRAGAISFFEEYIACYGLDHLLFVNPEDGTIEKQLHLPRIEKLFCPIRMKDGSMLIGYTNWTNAGILRYEENSGEILWRYKRNLQGPLGNCQIYLRDSSVYWTKNDTELICLNTETGLEVTRFRTAPWRYTDLRFHDRSLLFGTSGADGFLYCLNADNCTLQWAVPMKEGCSFFDIGEDHIFTGDYSKRLFRFSLADGTEQDILFADAEIIGDIKMKDHSLYTILWGNENRPIRLVKVSLI